MAGDLIPPPSPAGRPAPNPVLEAQGGPAEVPAPEPDARAEPPVPSPFRARFGFVLGALAGIALCAAAVAVTLVATASESQPGLAANWSQWEPASSETLAAAKEIADHVGPRYTLDDGEQLVAVVGEPFNFQGLPVGVMVRPRGQPIEVLEGNGLMYVLNGLEDQGALAGEPSEARGNLLRREALELVLYTFRYLEDVTMVAVMLPPTQPVDQGEAQAAPKGDDETAELVQQAMFFRPGDLLRQLQVPLARTLAPNTPRPGTLTTAEADRLDELVLDHLFLAEYQRAPDGLAYLVLEEPINLD